MRWHRNQRHRFDTPSPSCLSLEKKKTKMYIVVNDAATANSSFNSQSKYPEVRESFHMGDRRYDTLERQREISEQSKWVYCTLLHVSIDDSQLFCQLDLQAGSLPSFFPQQTIRQTLTTSAKQSPMLTRIEMNPKSFDSSSSTYFMLFLLLYNRTESKV